MRRLFFILLFGVFGYSFVLGQNSLLLGKVYSDHEPAPFVTIILATDSLDFVAATTSSIDGSYSFNKINNGIYKLTTQNSIFSIDTIIYGIRVNCDTTININLKPCDIYYNLNKCPICHSVDQVIRVGSDGILEFKEPWSDQQFNPKISRKTRKLGYYVYQFGDQELLYFVIDENGNFNYNDKHLCDRLLFCKRDKIVFNPYAP